VRKCQSGFSSGSTGTVMRRKYYIHESSTRQITFEKIQKLSHPMENRSAFLCYTINSRAIFTFSRLLLPLIKNHLLPSNHHLRLFPLQELYLIGDDNSEIFFVLKDLCVSLAVVYHLYHDIRSFFEMERGGG
jgi:hypothetical protein